MKLITKDIEEKLKNYPLYSQDGKGEDAQVVIKYFNPVGAGTWYVLEGEKQENGDFLFFGYVELLEGEYGYFTLNQLKNIALPFGLKIERDLHTELKTIGEMKNY